MARKTSNFIPFLGNFTKTFMTTVIAVKFCFLKFFLGHFFLPTLYYTNSNPVRETKHVINFFSTKEFPHLIIITTNFDLLSIKDQPSF